MHVFAASSAALFSELHPIYIIVHTFAAMSHKQNIYMEIPIAVHEGKGVVETLSPQQNKLIFEARSLKNTLTLLKARLKALQADKNHTYEDIEHYKVGFYLLCRRRDHMDSHRFFFSFLFLFPVHSVSNSPHFFTHSVHVGQPTPEME